MWNYGTSANRNKVWIAFSPTIQKKVHCPIRSGIVCSVCYLFIVTQTSSCESTVICNPTLPLLIGSRLCEFVGLYERLNKTADCTEISAATTNKSNQFRSSIFIQPKRTSAKIWIGSMRTHMNRPWSGNYLQDRLPHSSQKKTQSESSDWVYVRKHLVQTSVALSAQAQMMTLQGLTHPSDMQS